MRIAVLHFKDDPWPGCLGHSVLNIFKSPERVNSIEHPLCCLTVPKGLWTRGSRSAPKKSDNITWRFKSFASIACQLWNNLTQSATNDVLTLTYC